MSKNFQKLRRLIEVQNRLKWLTNIDKKLKIGHIGKFKNR